VIALSRVLVEVLFSIATYSVFASTGWKVMVDQTIPQRLGSKPFETHHDELIKRIGACTHNCGIMDLSY